MSKPIEAELKYLVQDDFDLINFILYLVDNGFTVNRVEHMTNEDTYYDTPDKELLKNGGSLRIRKTNKSKIKGTLKYPIDSNEVYTKRLEIEKSLEDKSFTELMSKLSGSQYDLRNICPYPILTINTNRQEITLSKDNNFIALAFDIIDYDGKAFDQMMEIELKGDSTPETLTEIDKLVQEKFNLKPTKQSKYKRGIEHTKLASLTRRHP